MLKFDESARIIASESRFVAGGVNSNFRIGMAARAAGLRARRGRLSDRRRWQPADRLLLRHGRHGAGPFAPPACSRRSRNRSRRASSLPASRRSNSKPRTSSASAFRRAERLRFGSSGSEVAQAALRLARAATGRRIILKFEGHYHGWFDNILWSTAPALADAGRAEEPDAWCRAARARSPIDARRPRCDRLERSRRRWKRASPRATSPA